MVENMEAEKRSIFQEIQNFHRIYFTDTKISIILKIIGISLTLIPILLGFFIIAFFTVDVPYADDWGFMGYTIQYYEGILSISDFFQSSGHAWLTLPNLLTTFLLIITKGDMNVLYYTTYLFYLCSFIFLIILIRKVIKNSSVLWLLLAPASWYFFNPLVISTMLWGTSVVYTLQLFFMMLAVTLLDRSTRFDIFYLGAVLSALAGTFSFTAGLCIWPALFLFILFKKAPKWKTQLIAWSVVSVAVFTFYFLTRDIGHVHFSHASGQLEAFISHPILFISSLSGIGSDIIFIKFFTVIFGLFILILLICLIISNISSLDLSNTAQWYCIIFYGLMAHLVLTIYENSSQSMWFYAHPIRFYSVTIILIVAIYLLIVCYLRNSFLGFSRHPNQQLPFIRNVVFFVIFILLLSLGAIVNVVPGLYHAYEYNDLQLHNQEIAENYSFCNDTDMINIATSIEYVSNFRNVIQAADRNNLSIFREGWKKQDPKRLSENYKNTMLKKIGYKVFRLS